MQERLHQNDNKKKIESFRDLIVWQKSHELVLDVFRLTARFPKKDQAYLFTKTRDTALIIPANIAAGFEKRGKKAKVHFYRLALTEMEQIRYMIILAEDLGYYKDSAAFFEKCENIEKMLKRLIRSIASSPNQ